MNSEMHTYQNPNMYPAPPQQTGYYGNAPQPMQQQPQQGMPPKAYAGFGNQRRQAASQIDPEAHRKQEGDGWFESKCGCIPWNWLYKLLMLMFAIVILVMVVLTFVRVRDDLPDDVVSRLTTGGIDLSDG